MTAPSPLTRTVALVGLMGVGKSSVGRRLAGALGVPFRDADEEIEIAAGRSVAEIFDTFGEAEFRAGERRVIARLLDEDPHVLATGGGAFVDPGTRALLNRRALTIWLKADLETLAKRVARKHTRPLLRGRDALEVLTAQADARYSAYAEARLHIETGEVAHAAAVESVLRALAEIPAQEPALSPGREHAVAPR